MDNLARRRLRFVRIQEQIEDIFARDQRRRDIARTTNKRKLEIPALHEIGEFNRQTLINPTPIDEGDPNPQRRNMRWKDTIELRWEPPQEYDPERSGFESLQMPNPDQGEVDHNEESIRALFEKYGKIQMIKVAPTKDKAIIKYKWLEDALNVASINLKAFNFQTTLDRRPRSFKSIGWHEPRIPPPLPVKDKYEDGSILMDRNHQRYVAMDAITTLCMTTIPQNMTDPAFDNIDVRHQYIDDEGVSMICRAMEGNNTVTSINLSHNRISHHGARRIIELLQGHISIIHVALQHQRPEEGYTMPLETGMKIECRYDGHHGHYPGVITDCRENGRFDVLYDDGDSEKNVPRELMRVPLDIPQYLLDKIDLKLREHKDFAPVGMSTGRITNAQLAKSGGWMPKLKRESPSCNPFHPSRHDPQNPRVGIKWVHPDGSNRNNCMFGLMSLHRWI